MLTDGSMFEHLDAFSAMALGAFGFVIGGFMVPIHFILQVRHDEEGFGWKEPVYASLAFSVGFGLIVAVGTALDGSDGSRFYLQDGLAVTAILLPCTLVAGLFGRFVGWLVMRALALRKAP